MLSKPRRPKRTPRKTKANGSSVDIGKIFRDGTAIDRAVRQATRQAVLDHKRAGHPIAVWRDGKVVWLQPDEI